MYYKPCISQLNVVKMLILYIISLHPTNFKEENFDVAAIAACLMGILIATDLSDTEKNVEAAKYIRGLATIYKNVTIPEDCPLSIKEFIRVQDKSIYMSLCHAKAWWDIFKANVR